MTALAVVVEKERVDDAIASLESAGLYDDTRRIVEHDHDRVELPVTAVPGPDVEGIDRVIAQADPDRRVTDLDDYLRARGFSDEELESVPRSWAVVGDVVLVRFPEDCSRREEVAAAILDLQGAETVLARKGIHGEHREPEVEVVAGSGDTETVHTEHGTKYALDLSRVMFSPGNEAERVRMGDVVEPGERVLDMFAGVGYFALPMARTGARVTAVERNPEAFRYLVENAPLNGVEDRFRPFRGDCREIVGSLYGDDGGEPPAERVVMGYYDAHEYLDAALSALAPGGVLHMHEAVPEALADDRPRSHLREAAGDRDREVEVLDERTVKTHSAGVLHVVVDARLHYR